jgi:hypothetical protein
VVETRVVTVSTAGRRGESTVPTATSWGRAPTDGSPVEAGKSVSETALEVLLTGFATLVPVVVTSTPSR